MTVAVDRGDALGFGCAMVVQTDVILVAEDTRMGFTEIRHGFAPYIVLSWIEVYFRASARSTY